MSLEQSTPKTFDLNSAECARFKKALDALRDSLSSFEGLEYSYILADDVCRYTAEDNDGRQCSLTLFFSGDEMVVPVASFRYPVQDVIPYIWSCIRLAEFSSRYYGKHVKYVRVQGIDCVDLEEWRVDNGLVPSTKGLRERSASDFIVAM